MAKSRRKSTPNETRPAGSAGEPPAADQQRDERTGDERTGDERTGDEQVRARAYELYLKRGGAPGDEVEDWLRAEHEYRERPGERRAAGGDGGELPGG